MGVSSWGHPNSWIMIYKEQSQSKIRMMTRGTGVPLFIPISGKLHMSNRQNDCNTKLVLLYLGLLHKTFRTDRGRPYTDTPFVRLPEILKSSQPI